MLQWNVLKRGEKHKVGADFIFYNFSRLREEARCCRLNSFGGISLGGNSFFGGGGRGENLTASALGAFSREHTGFPGNEKPGLQSSAERPRLGLGCPDYYPRPRSHHPTLPGRSWVGEVQKCQLCKMWAPVPTSPPPHSCKQLLIPGSLLSRALWLSMG